MQALKGMKLVFLVSMDKTDDDHERLYEDHSHHGDIVESSLTDGHRMLGYKIRQDMCGQQPHMRGNWSVSKEEYKDEMMYMTTLRVGAALVQAGQRRPNYPNLEPARI